MLHSIENDDAPLMDGNGDETLPVLEPIVAPVSEAPLRSTVATVTPQRSNTAMDCSLDDVAKLRQQCRRQQRQREQWVQHILRSEPLPAATNDEDDDDTALRNAIYMLQQRVVLAAEEASTAVADANALRRALAVEQEHRAAQATRMAALEQQVQALHQRNAQLVVERRVLKQAYTQLKQHSTVALERYVEQALYQHEEQLVAEEQRCRRKTTDVDSATTTSSSCSEEDDDDDGFEALDHMTDEPATPEGCTVIAQDDDDDDDDDDDWIPTALAVPYTPVRIVPSDERHQSSSGKRRARTTTTRQPILSLLEEEQKSVERSGTPTTTTTSSSDTAGTTTTTTPSATPPSRATTTVVTTTTTSDPLMFRSLAIPMH